MSKKRRKQNRKRSKNRQAKRWSNQPVPEADTLVVAWTVSVTAVVVCDLAAVAAHLYAQFSEPTPALQSLAGLLLLSAAAMGLLSLVLLAVVRKLREVRPPQGFTVFAILAAVAPIAAVVIRLLMSAW